MANQPITDSEVALLNRGFKLTATLNAVAKKLGISEGRAKTLLERAKWRVAAADKKTKPYVWRPRTAK